MVALQQEFAPSYKSSGMRLRTVIPFNTKELVKRAVNKAMEAQENE